MNLKKKKKKFDLHGLLPRKCGPVSSCVSSGRSAMMLLSSWWRMGVVFAEASVKLGVVHGNDRRVPKVF